MNNTGIVGLKSYFILFLALLWAMPAMADDAYELGEIRVTAPIIEGNVTDPYGGQKTLVSEEQIEDLNAQDLTSALRRTPGVTISRYNPVGSFGGGEGGAVFIRGMGSSRPGSEIKAYVDGVPMYMSIWNHPLMDLLAIDAARSVEVYKSPQPQNFGNAVAAVNILPKRREATGVSSRTKLAWGSYDTMVATAENGGRFEQMDYYVGGGYRRSDGHREQSAGRTKDLYGRLGYQFNDQWSLSFFGLVSDNSAEDPGEAGADPSLREGTYETTAGLTSLTLSHTHTRSDGYIKLYRNAGEGNWLDQPANTPGVTEDLYNDFEFYGIKARETFYAWEGGELLTGLDWEYTSGDYQAWYSDGSSDHWDGDSFTLVSPYAAFSHTFQYDNGVCLTPSAGVRYYDNSLFGREWAPHAGAQLAFGPWQVHGGYSRGVVFPGLDVIVFSDEVIPVLGDSWKDLDPEIMDHYEVGVSWSSGSAPGRAGLVSGDLTWFYNEGKDRYVFVTGAGGPPQYDNVESYTTKGVEISVAVYPLDELALFFGAVFMRADPTDLPYAPEKSFSAGLNWRFLERVVLNLDAQYVDDMYVNSQARRAGAENSRTVADYAVVNAKLSYEFTLHKDAVSGTFFIAGENLTDAGYEHRPGYPMPGINGMAGVCFTF